ncbi:MAG: DUF1365 domain-containing protein [Hyphomonadaceae bacterium]
MTTPALYHGGTTHTRRRPFQRQFSYRLFHLWLDIDTLAQTLRPLRMIRYNRFGLFSFHDADHGDRSGAPLRPWAESMFARAGISLDGGAISLLTFPRILGYVFNPISVFVGYGPNGAPRGVIYEVNNTFGETHAYVAALAGEAPFAHAAKKMLHVSPFYDVRGDYRFAFSPPEEAFALRVENVVAGQCEHVAIAAGAHARLTDAALLRAFFTVPLMTLGVAAAIHWQALGLWLRGARYRRKPAPPKSPATTGNLPPRANII